MTASRSTEAAMDTTTTAEAAVPRLAPEAFAERAAVIEREVGRVIVGQRELVRQTLTGLLANSHVLLEGVPGLGKTMLVRTMSEALELGFSRIQFTPDLMPADVIGTVTDDRYQFHADEPFIFANRINENAGGSFNGAFNFEPGLRRDRSGAIVHHVRHNSYGYTGSLSDLFTSNWFYFHEIYVGFLRSGYSTRVVYTGRTHGY